MQTMIRLSCFCLAVTLAFGGCSSFTKQGRQQAAYAKYVRKMSKGRVKQQKKFHTGKPQMPTAQPSGPLQKTESGPLAPPSEPQ